MSRIKTTSTESRPTHLESWSSISKKTVFVLDKSNYFTQVSSGHSIIGDPQKEASKRQTSTANETPIEPFDRSLWTCTVEAVVGYSRIVWDLFSPDQRCISIIAINPQGSRAPSSSAASGLSHQQEFVEKLCSWRDEDQNLDHLMNSLGKQSYPHQSNGKLKKLEDISSLPNCNSESLPLINTLDQALAELSHSTHSQVESQHQRQSSPTRSSSPSLHSQLIQQQTSENDNNGRVVLISSFQNQNSIDEISKKFEFLLKNKNEFIKSQFGRNNINFKTINYCDLVIVNTFPIHDTGLCSKIHNSDSFRPNLHVSIYSVSSGRNIAGLLNNLCLQHHNLRSTTITGIPMKEEQNASSSSQYDVEVVHCSSIHDEIIKKATPPLVEDVVEVIDRNGFPCESFKLSWCTPKYFSLQLDHCVATSRITAVDVNSRPSSCLTNFLLNGRAVMLEIFKSKNNRTATHVLASHNGELYIHSLATSQSKQALSDAPSITDQLGGKVGDYRANDFAAFMKQHTLTKAHLQEEPLTRTSNILRRQTLYWPISLGHTILLNIPNILGKLTQIIPKESLTLGEIDECRRAIDNLVKAEREGQGLPSVSIVELMKNPSSGNAGSNQSKSGNQKLEQLYRLLWNELEHFLRIHSSTLEHEAVVEYLLEKHGDKKSATQTSGGKSVTARGAKRAAGRRDSSSSSSPTPKRLSVAKTEKLLPEVGAELDPNYQRNSMFFKTGFSLFNTWTQLYHLYHKSKSKLTFVGRNPPLEELQQQPPPQAQAQAQPEASGQM